MLLTVKQAAQHAAVSPSLVYGWCADGTLRHLRLGRAGRRGAIRIDTEDLDALLASLRQGGTPPDPAPPVNPAPLPRPRHIRLKP